MAERVWAWLQRTGKVALANPVAMVTAIAVGAIAAFVYSYVPLHGAKDWQI